MIKISGSEEMARIKVLKRIVANVKLTSLVEEPILLFESPNADKYFKISAGNG